MARPSKFTPEARKRVLEAISLGNTRTTAANYAGISPSLLRGWLANGKKGGKKNAEFLAFLADIKKAEAKAIVAATAGIRKAGQKSWQALAWWLERRYPEDWSIDRDVLRELKKFLKDHKQQEKRS